MGWGMEGLGWEKVKVGWEVVVVEAKLGWGTEELMAV